MKPRAYLRYKYSAELYKFVREIVGDTSTLKYYFVGIIPLSAGVDKTGKLIVKLDRPLAVGTVIANVRDSDNNLILEDTAWQVSNVNPVLNSFNNIEEYRLTTTKYLGTLPYGSI